MDYFYYDVIIIIILITAINQTVVGSEDKLFIDSINAPMHGGEYICVVMNDAGIGIATTVLNVPVEFVTHPQSINTTINSVFNLTCIAEAFPSPTIQWEKNDSNTGVQSGLIGENMTYLEFDPVEYDEFGLYKCRAYNEINGEKFDAVSDIALVSVSPEGSIDVTQANMTFDYQDVVTFICSVSGGPRNTFRWFVNNTEISSGINGVSIVSTLFSSTLNISSVSAPVHGGDYKCEARNDAGFDEITTLLYVSPRFLEEPAMDTIAANGTNTALVCRAEAYPTPRYTWYDERNSTQAFQDPEPLLKFEPVIFGDESTYRCMVLSNGSSITSSGRLHGTRCMHYYF